MTSILDNPVWHALISGNKALAHGSDMAKVFAPDVSPIVGLAAYTPAHFEALYEIVSADRTIVIFSVDDLVIPDAWNVLLRLSGYQMIYTGSGLPAMQTDESIVPLTEAHIPQMLALTQLTNPGPFSSRTIDFGVYEGIFKEGELVAMAGQRLHPYNYVEISAVCTHPNYVGKGYAKQLIVHQINRIIGEGNTPFLHVRDDNDRALNVYYQLGFKTRTAISFTILQRKA